ncbi:MAG: M16 family metallopeptidase [Candidatus Kapaibacterium sp.]
MKRTLLSFFALILFLGLSISQDLYSQPDLDKKLPFDPKVKIGKLDNGITYYIRQNEKPENRAELQIVVKAGSILEDDDQAGLAHFVEHMAFNGTKNFPKNELIEFLEGLGMRFGADVNANTGFDRTYYMITVPTDTMKKIDQGLQVLEDWAHNVSFDQEEIDKERLVILEEWRVYRGANERVNRKHYPVMLYNSRYADRLPIGDTAVIMNAPRQRFLDFYNDWYRPDLTAVIAVGDFDVNMMEEKIKKQFSGIKMPENAKPRPEFEIPLGNEPMVSVAKDKELPYNIAQIIVKRPEGPKFTHRAYRTNLVNNLYSTMLSMRLQEYLQKPESPFNFVAQGGLGGFIGDVEALTLVGIIKSGQIEKGVETLLIEGFRADKHGFNKSELDRAKEQMMSMIEKYYNERDKNESMNYAQEYMRNFIEDESMPGIEYEYNLYKQFLPTISLDEINELAKTTIQDQDLVITVSAQDTEDAVIPAKDEIMAVYEKVKDMDIMPYEDITSDKPLMERKPTPGTITGTEKNDKLGIEILTLSNGAEVVLKKTDFKNDEILMRAYSPGGTSLADTKYFRDADMAASIVDNAGIADFDANTLRKMLTGKNISVSPYIGELTEGFRGNTTPKDIETLFQLVHLYFTSPRKDPESFKSFISQQKDYLNTASRDPSSVLGDTVSAVLYQHHPRYMPLTAAGIDMISLEKAYEFYKERFSDASDFTFFFVGNYDDAKMKDMIKTYIASLPATNRNEKWKDVGARMAQKKIEKEVKKGIEPKSSVRLIFTGDFDYNRENRWELKALTEALNIRLREVIREDKGGVYGIGVFPRMNHYPYESYAVYVYFSTNPDRVEELVSAIDEVILDFKEVPVEKKYVQKVKEITKKEYETSIKENKFWLNALYQYDYNNENPEVLLETPEMADKLTAKDIQKAAKKYLNYDSRLKVVLNPED